MKTLILVIGSVTLLSVSVRAADSATCESGRSTYLLSFPLLAQIQGLTRSPATNAQKDLTDPVVAQTQKPTFVKTGEWKLSNPILKIAESEKKMLTQERRDAFMPYFLIKKEPWKGEFQPYEAKTRALFLNSKDELVTISSEDTRNLEDAILVKTGTSEKKIQLGERYELSVIGFDQKSSKLVMLTRLPVERGGWVYKMLFVATDSGKVSSVSLDRDPQFFNKGIAILPNGQVAIAASKGPSRDDTVSNKLQIYSQNGTHVGDVILEDFQEIFDIFVHDETVLIPGLLKDSRLPRVHYYEIEK